MTDFCCYVSTDFTSKRRIGEKKNFPNCAVHAITLQNGVAAVKVFISE